MVDLRVFNIEPYRGGFTIRSSVFKTLGPNGLPMGFLKLSKCPLLLACMTRFLGLVQGPYVFGDSVEPASLVCQDAFRLVCEFGGTRPPLFQTHGLKRGTVSLLKRLKMSLEDINLHCGWSLTSTTYEVYRRFVLVEDSDRDFFFDLLV